jgi:hypothetical protein
MENHETIGFSMPFSVLPLKASLFETIVGYSHNKKGLPRKCAGQPFTVCCGGLSSLFWLGRTQGGFQLLEREAVVV